MKRLLSSLLLSALVAVPWPTLAVVPRFAFSAVSSTIAGDSGSGATTSSINTTGSDLIVVVGVGAGATNVLTDSASNTWTMLSIPPSVPNVRIFYALNPTTSSSHTFSWPGSDGGVVAVSAWSGAHDTSSFDQESVDSTAVTTTVQPGSITPTEDNELIIVGGSARYGAGNDLTSIDDGYTLLHHLAVGTYNWSGAIAYKIQTTAAATNPTFTGNNADNYSAAIASFKASGGGGGPASFVHGILNAPVRGGGVVR